MKSFKANTFENFKTDGIMTETNQLELIKRHVLKPEDHYDQFN